jgi:cellulose synthase/poly-beta-1,6-N-acetylglucosamine synthase-like glycosyltransferase
MSFLIVLSILVFLISFCSMLLVFWGSLKMQCLCNIPYGTCSHAPLVSIIVPACNEATTLEPALRSLLQQDYANLEIIVLDDRSTDTTFEIMSKLRKEFPIIQAIQIKELPIGWLGKNHALYSGAKKARGNILLFTDADIVMERSTISRAVAYFVDEDLDHLSLIFRNVTPGGLLNAMIVDSLGGLFLLLRPWEARKKTSNAFIGVGAFNMIRSKAYWELGGHEGFKMHPIDDIMLGKRVKQLGLTQDCLQGGEFVKVRWYESVPEMVHGLMKNIFALYSYRIDYAVVALLGIILLTIVPVWGLFVPQVMVRTFFGAAILCRLSVFVCNARGMNVASIVAPWALVTPYLTVFIIVKAVWKTLQNQGIDWRGTHYPLKELKQEDQLFTFFKSKRTS